MEHLRLHRRSILTGKTELVEGANVIALAANDTAVVVFDDEPDRKRWYTVSDGVRSFNSNHRFQFWVGEPT